MRVIQGGDRAGLALEPLLQIGIGGDVLGEHLDGDGAVQPGVASLVDLALATRAEGGLDLVGTEGCAWREGHRLVDGDAFFEFLEPVLDDDDPCEAV